MIYAYLLSTMVISVPSCLVRILETPNSTPYLRLEGPFDPGDSPQPPKETPPAALRRCAAATKCGTGRFCTHLMSHAHIMT